MPIIAKVNKAAPIPAGVYQAVCYSVADIGTQPQQNAKFRATRKVVLTFELPHERAKFERDGKTVDLPRAISATFSLSLGKKANLRRELESWRGRTFTDKELEGFDLKNVLGKNCQVNIVHTNRNGEVYANVQNIMPLGKGMATAAAENPQLYFSLDDFLASEGRQWPEMPDWLKGRAMQSEEYLAATGNESQPSAPVADAGEQQPDDDANVPF